MSNPITEAMPEGHCKVAVVLLSYNCKHLLEDFLPKILDTTPNSKDYNVFVVDNASTDGTWEWLRGNFPQTSAIQIAVNQGFTNGYKESLALIKADYYVLISSDVEVAPNWLEPAIAVLDSDPNIAVVQPKIRSYHEREKFEYAGASGGYLDKLCYPFCRGRIFYSMEEDHGQYDEVDEIFWASGACFFIRADVYHKTGGLDDDFYAHMEEIDLCWRIRNLGYRIMVCPQSVVFHMGGAVIAYGSPAKVYRNHRNNLIMMMKNLPPGEVVWQILFRFMLDQLAFVNMLKGGQFKAAFSIYHAHIDFCLKLPHWRRKRKAILAERVSYRREGIYPRSIVAAYFLRKVRTFSELKWR